MGFLPDIDAGNILRMNLWYGARSLLHDIDKAFKAMHEITFRNGISPDISCWCWYFHIYHKGINIAHIFMQVSEAIIAFSSIIRESRANVVME